MLEKNSQLNRKGFNLPQLPNINHPKKNEINCRIKCRCEAKANDIDKATS